MADPQAQQGDQASAAVQSLDRKLFHGIAWNVAVRWAAQGFSWAGTYYAAHRLTPGNYGLVAMASLPIGLFRTVEEFGLDAVLVQNRDLQRDQLARLAGLALLIGFILCGGFLVASRPIAEFNHEPLVALLVCALSTNFILDALQILPRATLQKELRFRTLAFVTALQFFVSAVTLVTCARLGFGPWALVFNSLAAGVVVTLVLIRLAPFPIAWPRDLKSIFGPIAAGWRMLVSRISWYGYSNGDQFLIGRVLGKDALGNYQFSMTFSGLPIQEITSVVSRVVPGVFSEVQSRTAELRRYFLLLTEAMFYLSAPAAVGLALTADRVVHIVLGPQWEAAILPFRVLCFYYAGYAAQVLVSHVLLWTGHFRANMWFSLLGSALLIGGFAYSVHSGLVAVAWCWVILFPLVSLPSLILAGRILEMRLREFFEVLLPAAVACAVMSVVVVFVRQRFAAERGDLAALGIEAFAGAATYVAMLALFYRRRVLGILRTVFLRRT